MILVKSIRYEITSERIKITSGIFSKQTSALELYRVKDYTLEAPFFYRLFHLGNINHPHFGPFQSADLAAGRSRGQEADG